MELKLYRTLWGYAGNPVDAVREAAIAGFHGIESSVPQETRDCNHIKSVLLEHGMSLIAEITTAGSYVPDRNASLDDHLVSLAIKLEHSTMLKPVFANCIGGCDAWPESMSVEFFGRAMEIANHFGIDISFETHRSRSFFNPWVTKRIVAQLPEIKLTCDYSHWCVVCERTMDSEMDVLTTLAPHAHHIHARVGYDQGPQVPHPAAPEYAQFLHAHQAWWEQIWRSQNDRGYRTSTMTPEFGPDGYLHLEPFTQKPVAELWEINRWMGDEERRHFQQVFAT